MFRYLGFEGRNLIGEYETEQALRLDEGVECDGRIYRIIDIGGQVQWAPMC
jgi:hypothetical protein